ncbi:MAG: hypothetical protein JSS27_19710 [Planctomycetes bacterium]|nr:hypothetical protein [Planctomycetota bacterium]
MSSVTDSPDSALPPGELRVADDLPGARLRLVRNGNPPWAWLRHCGPLVVVLVASFFEAPFRHALVAQLTGDKPFPPSGDDVILDVILVGALIMAWTGASGFAQLVAYWSELSWDAQERVFTGRRRGWLWWSNETVTVPFEQIEQFWFRLGPEGRGLAPITFVQVYRDERGKSVRLEMNTTLDGVDTRAVASHQFWALARILGATNYAEREKSAQLLGYEVLLPWSKRQEYYADTSDTGTSESDDEDDKAEASTPEMPPIPDRADPPAPSFRARRKPIASPESLPPINLKKIQEQLTTTQLAEWRPGERVRFLQPHAPKGALGCVAVFGAIAGALLGIWFIEGWLHIFLHEDVVHRWLVATLAGTTGACLCLFMAYNQWREREVTFDWRRERVYLRQEESVVDRPFDAIQGICEFAQENRSKDEAATYQGRLELILPERNALLLASEVSNDSLSARELIRPVGRYLAAALGVEYSHERPQGPNVNWRELLRFTAAQWAVFGLIGVVAVASLARAFTGDTARRDAGTLVRAQGAEAVWMTGFSLRDKLVAKNYWNVRFPEKARNVDPHLAALTEPLRAMSPLGIDLSQTDASDAGVGELSDLPNLRVLNLSQTLVTNDGLKLLASSPNLVYVNLFGTRVDDGIIDRLSGHRRLRFIYLGATGVTDEGLEKLRDLPALEYLHLSAARVTREGVQRLRTRLPGVEIDHLEFR